MPEAEDPRRPSHTAYLNHRIKMTKKKAQKIETGFYKYIYETGKLSGVMNKLVNVFSIYGTEESGETGAMLRVFARILRQTNDHRIKRQKMLSDVGTNLRHLKGVYREAEEMLKEYKESYGRFKSARKKYAATRSLMKTGKSVRLAQCMVARRESEFFVKKRILKKTLDEFDMKLRKALMNFFFQFVKCEMYMAARMLETFSTSNSQLQRWNREMKEMKEWVVSRSLRQDSEITQN